MSIESGKIPSSQLCTLMVGFLLGSTLIISPGQQAGRDIWIAAILGFLEGLAFALIYILLLKKFPGKTIIQINDFIFGKYLGKVVSIFYLWFFFHLGSMVLRNFGDFFTAVIYPETPMVVLMAMLMLVSAMAVRNGIEVISRTSIILVPLTFLIVFFTMFFSIKDMDFTNFLPVLETPLRDVLLAGHNIAAFPFGESIAFVMVIPFLGNPKKTKATVFLAFSLALFLFIGIVVRNISILGDTASLHAYPSYEAVRLIKIADILTRLEIAVAANFLIMGFLKIIVLYYAVSLGTAQLFNLRTYLPLVIPIGALMIFLSIFQFSSNIENIEFATKVYPFYSLPFEVFLPALTLMISFFKKPNKKRGLKK